MGIMHELRVAAGQAISGVHAGVDRLTSSKIEAPETLHVETPSFVPDHEMPARYTKEGGDVSPLLRITGTPPAARELVLLCEDPDAPKRSPFVHWLVYGIRPDMEVVLDEGVGNQARATSFAQGKNGRNQVGYTGAAPPLGHGAHHYHFQVFALDTPLVFADPAPTRDDLVEAMRGHVIAKGDLVGTYERS
jgi:Raf kinase inhibitor-like YbhB/YbcL family protein